MSYAKRRLRRYRRRNLKIQVLSDIHLEFGPPFDIKNEGADVLVLSGDICTAHRFEVFLPFFKQCSDQFGHVVYVAGNHEHYHGNLQEDFKIISKYTREEFTNVHYLEKDWIEIDGVYFFGATLWTDLNRGNPETALALKNFMNDYRLIHNGSEKLKPQDTLAEFNDTIACLDALLTHDPEKVVVCTHHAPSKQSTHPRYKQEYHVNGGYSSDLEDFIIRHPEIKLWTHGHTHDSFDYMVDNTRVVANPAGYPVSIHNDRENPLFDPKKVIEI